jgi:hypothetical protein
MKKILAATAVLVLTATVAMGATLVVSWTPTRNRTWPGTRSSIRPPPDLNWLSVDVGNVVTTNIVGVDENIEYCAYVVAYDASGNESAHQSPVCSPRHIPPARSRA